MNMLDRIIGLVAPHECLGCGEEGGIMCHRCTELFPDLPERCYRCRLPSANGLTCPACSKTSNLSRVRAATDYEGVAQGLVWRLKFSGARATVEPMTECMVPLLVKLMSSDTLIAPVPTATNRVRQRGYDQAKLLAWRLSSIQRVPYVNCLARHGQTHQVGASRAQRLRQLERAFRVTQQRAVKNAHIILIDDVITTGATLEAAAGVLRYAGASQVDALVFAQP